MLDPKMNQIGVSIINGMWNNKPSVVVVYDMIDTKQHYMVSPVFSDLEIKDKDCNIL